MSLKTSIWCTYCAVSSNIVTTYKRISSMLRYKKFKERRTLTLLLDKMREQHQTVYLFIHNGTRKHSVTTSVFWKQHEIPMKIHKPSEKTRSCILTKLCYMKLYFVSFLSLVILNCLYNLTNYKIRFNLFVAYLKKIWKSFRNDSS